MNTRRKLLFAFGAGAFAAPLSSFAQPQARVYRIGILTPDTLESRGPFVEVFKRAMRELGYIEGKNVAYDPRYADGDLARLSALAAELAGQSFDVIVVSNSLAAEAAAKATRTIPIVFTSVADPIASGLAASLARPGGNVTGISNITIELAGKQLQLLKEAFPKISRVAVFIDPTVSVAAAYLGEAERAAKALGVQVLSAEVRSGDDVEKSVVALRKWRADSIFVLNTPANYNNRKLLVQIAGKTRLPAIYGTDTYAESGGLISYGSNDKPRWQQAARFVDKILKGAKPADLPIEQPTKFELVINMKTAKALGIKIPQSVLARADRVIE
jgi:putative ABC transport system substrate-binding protein